MLQCRPIACVVFLCCACAYPCACAADQPQWGQRFSRNMISDEKDLPDSFDTASGANIKWVAKLGTDSYATPVLAAGKVFIGTNNSVPRDPRH